MDIFFEDPSEIPLPPAETRIRSLKAQPWPDGRRVKISLELDPFQKHPSLEMTLLDPGGSLAGSVDIIETMSRKMELNMHLRGEPVPGEYTLKAVLFYLEHRPARRGRRGSEYSLPAFSSRCSRYVLLARETCPQA